MGNSYSINFNLYPSHIRVAILAVLRWQENAVDDMGYDAELYKYDLPRVVAEVLGNNEAAEFIRNQ